MEQSMIIDYIKSHYEVRMRDTDPDTGEVCRDWPIALTKDTSSAEMIANALNRCSYEPNRDFYTVYRDTIVNC